MLKNTHKSTLPESDPRLLPHKNYTGQLENSTSGQNHNIFQDTSTNPANIPQEMQTWEKQAGKTKNVAT